MEFVVLFWGNGYNGERFWCSGGLPGSKRQLFHAVGLGHDSQSAFSHPALSQKKSVRCK
jgi:hypothetical protein